MRWVSIGVGHFVRDLPGSWRWVSIGVEYFVPDLPRFRHWGFVPDRLGGYGSVIENRLACPCVPLETQPFASHISVIRVVVSACPPQQWKTLWICGGCAVQRYRLRRYNADFALLFQDPLGASKSACFASFKLLSLVLNEHFDTISSRF